LALIGQEKITFGKGYGKGRLPDMSFMRCFRELKKVSGNEKSLAIHVLTEVLKASFNAKSCKNIS
jgi:hypothetical protein